MANMRYAARNLIHGIFNLIAKAWVAIRIVAYFSSGRFLKKYSYFNVLPT